MKVGIMIVGINGVNASTLIAGCAAIQMKEYETQYGITSSIDFANLDLIEINDLVFTGWDYSNKNQYELFNEYSIVKIKNTSKLKCILDNVKSLKGIHTNKDIRIEDRFDYYIVPSNIKTAIQIIENDIEKFKTKHSLNSIIVIYLGSPSKRVLPELKKFTYEEILTSDINEVPSSLIYAIAAIKKGAHYIDFTPSETLEFGFLWQMAERYGVQISGRDGSTGQTMLKLTIANMLRIRNLKLRAWYSTNILGNHDGLVLSDYDYRKTKIEDKMYGIAPLLGYNDFEHKVTIDFFKTRFDFKESWDSIDFSGWLKTPMQMKINWQGEDAILSAPILLDLIRLIAYGENKRLCGFQKQLGLFYKHPFGCDGMSLEQMYQELIRFYTTI